VRFRTVLFELYGTLIDSQRAGPQHWAAVARLLAERHGGEADEWLSAYQSVRADWGSYWADLNIGGDEGLANFEEGNWRVIRALFRLTGRDYPPLDDLRWYVHELPALAAREVSAPQPDAEVCLRRLAAEGYALGVVTEALSAVGRGLLKGANVARWFGGPVVGIDDVDRGGRPVAAFQTAIARAGVPLQACLVVDSGPGVAGAKGAGAQVALIERRAVSDEMREQVDVVLPDLIALADWLEAK
jgi:beta-phosphoglucomutase-like phosphatase (HAD superfamily)